MTGDEWKTYGVNETEEGLTSVEEGDELRLKLSWMTEASGHESGKADVVVTEVDEDEERVYIEDKNERIRTLPRGGTWYTDMYGTAYREESPHYAYSIDLMRVRLTDDEQQELVTDAGHERPKFVETGERYHPTRGEDEPSGWDYYECPSCGASVCTLCDCPECGWYNEDLWRGAIREAVQVHGDDVWTGDVSVEAATDGGGDERLYEMLYHYNEVLEEIRDAEQRQADALERLAGIQMMMYLARDDTGKYSPEPIAEDALLHGSGGEHP
jgi:hypothetical protein